MISNKPDNVVGSVITAKVLYIMFQVNMNGRFIKCIELDGVVKNSNSVTPAPAAE